MDDDALSRVQTRLQLWKQAPKDAVIPYHLAADAILYELEGSDDESSSGHG